MTTTRWTVLPLLLTTLCQLAVAGGDPPSEVVAAPAAATPAVGERGFTLGLEHEAEPRFHLFGERTGGSDVVSTAPSSGEPASAVDLMASLVYAPGEHPVPDDLRINLKPRTWGDLDGWEKVGVVVSYAGSIAGTAYLASRLID